MTATIDATVIDEAKVEEVALGAIGHLNGLATALSIHYGRRLGLFDALVQHGPVTSEELAQHLGFNERWVREWLHQQAAARVIKHEAAARFWMMPEAALVLADSSTPASMAAFFDGVRSTIATWEHLPEVLRTGRGRNYDELGDDVAQMVESGTLPWNEFLIGQALPALDDVVAKLETGAQAIDFGCGTGARTVGLAAAFPDSTWRGFDTSTLALERAAAHLAESDVTNVSFHNPDQEPVPDDHSVDLVTLNDVAHDLPFPQQVLEIALAALKPDGTLMISDIAQPEATVDKFDHPAAPFFYGISMGVCLSSATSEEGGAGLGPLGLSEEVLRGIATATGFTRFRRTEVQDPFNAYYELRP